MPTTAPAGPYRNGTYGVMPTGPHPAITARKGHRGTITCNIAADLTSDGQPITAGTQGHVINVAKGFTTLITDDNRELVVNARLTRPTEETH